MAAQRILVVDDSVDSAASMALLLQLKGHEVQAAHDGPQAIAVASSFRPDLILLDIGMPGMDGYEVCRRIRQEPWGASLTIAALTGWGRSEDEARAFDAGFSYHLVKPVEPEALDRIIADLGTPTRP